MKIKIEVDATPKEVREALGLPDIQAVQERIIAKVEKRVMDAVTEYDPTKLMSLFLPAGFQLTEGMQKMFMSSLPNILNSGSKKG